MEKQSEQRILHANQAKVSNQDGKFFTSQSVRAHTPPKQYSFDTLPGCEEDLAEARKKAKRLQ